MLSNNSMAAMTLKGVVDKAKSRAEALNCIMDIHTLPWEDTYKSIMGIQVWEQADK